MVLGSPHYTQFPAPSSWTDPILKQGLDEYVILVGQGFIPVILAISDGNSLFAIWGVDPLGLDPLPFKSQKNAKKSQKFMSDCGITKRQ